MSTVVVFGALVVGWGAYLAYWWKDARPASRGSDVVGEFSNRLSRLSGSRPPLRSDGSLAFELMPRSAADAARRRGQIVLGLSVGVVLTLLGALAFGWTVFLLHLLVDAALCAYVYAVVQRRNLAAEREIKVQMLYPEGVTSLAARRQSKLGS